MTRSRRQPQRSCTGCRQVFDQQDLLRYVCSPEGRIVPDLRNRLPGRGVYTCWSRACIDQAVRKRQFDRAFRQACQPFQSDWLVGEIRLAVSSRLFGLLGMGRKSAQLVAGSNAVLAALNNEQRLALVVLAEDISAGVREKVCGKAVRSGALCLDMFDKLQLGQITGRAQTSVLGLYQGKLAEAFAADLHKYRNVSGES